MGHMGELTEETQEALADQDFTAGPLYFDIEHGVSFGQINLHVIDDVTPEVDEVFLVNLTGMSQCPSLALIPVPIDVLPAGACRGGTAGGPGDELPTPSGV